MAPEPTDKRFVLLSEKDNILVCCAHVAAGESVQLEGRFVTLSQEIPVGHKLARRAIAPGERIVKYGAPIGSATIDIKCAEHVHLHNMRSDYISSHTRQGRGSIL